MSSHWWLQNATKWPSCSNQWIVALHHDCAIEIVLIVCAYLSLCLVEGWHHCVVVHRCHKLFVVLIWHHLLVLSLYLQGTIGWLQLYWHDLLLSSHHHCRLWALIHLILLHLLCSILTHDHVSLHLHTLYLRILWSYIRFVNRSWLASNSQRFLTYRLLRTLLVSTSVLLLTRSKLLLLVRCEYSGFFLLEPFNLSLVFGHLLLLRGYLMLEFIVCLLEGQHLPFGQLHLLFEIMQQLLNFFLLLNLKLLLLH